MESKALSDSDSAHKLTHLDTDFNSGKRETRKMIETFALGRTKVIAAEFTRNALAHIRDLVFPAMVAGIKSEVFARRLCEAIFTTLQTACDPVVLRVATTGFQLDEYAQEIANEIEEMCCNKNEGAKLKAPTAPNETYILGNAEDEFDTEMEAARDELHTLLKKKQALSRKEITPTKSDGAVHTRSKSNDQADIQEQDTILAQSLEEDIQYAKYIISEVQRKIDRKFRQLFQAATVDYNTALARTEAAVEKKAKNEDKLDKLGVLQTVITGIRSILQAMVEKIKTTIVQSKCRSMQEILQRSIVLPNGQAISSPWDQGHVSGMLLALYKNYQTPSLLILSEELINAFKYKLDKATTDKYPNNAVSHIEAMIRTFDSLKLWEFMTKDMLLSTLLINSMHYESDVCNTLYKQSQEFLRDAEYDEDMIQCIQNGTATPLYNRLKELVKTEESVLKYKKNINVSEKKQYNGHQQRSGWKNDGQSGTETAASAETSVTSKRGADPSKPVIAKKTPCVVTRKENILYTFKDRVVMYTSTKQPCTMCANRDNPDNPHRQFYCYQGQCSACGHYGHVFDVCGGPPDNRLLRCNTKAATATASNTKSNSQSKGGNSVAMAARTNLYSTLADDIDDEAESSV